MHKVYYFKPARISVVGIYTISVYLVENKAKFYIIKN